MNLPAAPLGRQLARGGIAVGRTVAKPGSIAWALALGLGGCAILLPHTAAARLWAAVIGATSILLLATARAWQARRRQVELHGLAAGLVLTGLMLARAPAAFQIGLTPVLMTIAVLGVLAWSEWKFAPDHGQQGLYWAVTEGIRGALWAGLGLALAMLATAVIGHDRLWLNSLLYGIGAVAGRAFGLLIAPAPPVSHHHPDFTAPGAENDPSAERSDADWWKQDRP